LVFDVRDSGTRFCTYITTMAYAMEMRRTHVRPCLPIEYGLLPGRGASQLWQRHSFLYVLMRVEYKLATADALRWFLTQRKCTDG